MGVGPLSVDQVTFRIFAALCAVLILKNLALAVLTAAARMLGRAWLNPEDARLLGGEVKVDERVERVRRAHQNSLENDPLFLIAGLLYLLVGAPESGMQAYGYTYVLARLAHAAFYVAGLQPFRTASFLVGWLACVGMSVQVLVKAFA